MGGAPPYPPEQIPEDYFPFSIVYPGNGVHTFNTPEERLFLGEIIVEIHVGRTDLPVDVESVIEFGDTVPHAIMADLKSNSSTLRGVVMDTFGPISSRFGGLGWGSKAQTIGFRFIISEVKIRSTL